MEVPPEVFLAIVGLAATVLPTAVGALVWALKSSHRQNDKLVAHNERMRVTLENHLVMSVTVLANLKSSQDAYFGRWEERWRVGKEEGAAMWKNGEGHGK